MIFSADISLTATGWACADGGKILDSGVIPGRGDGMLRMIKMRNQVMDRMDRAKPQLVVIEDFSYGSKGAALFQIAGLGYMIRAELVTDGRQWVAVSPSGLKKFACGSAGSSKAPVRKEHVLKAVWQRFAIDVSDNNQADAIVLGFIGMALVGEWEPTTDPQRAVLDAIRKAHKGLDLMALQTGAAAGEGWS